jgi:hypothetical protein
MDSSLWDAKQIGILLITDSALPTTKGYQQAWSYKY